MTDKKNPGTFQVGLCMAGAVSAGAYTAGVMDYLLEVLGEWEERKRTDPENTPRHDVEIPVMGGASAGGMTALISGIAIHENHRPIRTREDAQRFGGENKLYHTWVNLTRDDMLEAMLDRSDLEDRNIYSILNSSFIDEIAGEVVKVKNPSERRHAGFAENLKLFATLSNLEGMKYSAELTDRGTSLSRYVMSSHNDYACFQLESPKGREPGWIKFDISPEADRSLIAQAAMATGAFPVGLRNRKVARKSADMNENKWFDGIRRHNSSVFGKDFYTAHFVDGGMINNEPFDRVREILNDVTGQIDEDVIHNYSRTNSTVLMIDPFPSEPEKAGDQNRSLLANSISATLGAMVGHLRIKPATLLDAMKSDRAGQYLISPIRYPKSGGAIEGKKALACGSLSGFAGFIHRHFREHDFFLGRANCERFLRRYFTMPEDAGNPFIDYGYAHLTEARRLKYRTVSSTTQKDEAGNEVEREVNHLPIIPIFSTEGDAPYIPSYEGRNWPRMEEKFIDKKKRALKRRVGRVLIVMADLAPFWQFLLWIGNHAILRRKIGQAILDKVKDDLREWGIMEKK
ncbi:MAG: patatin-like phospholipase family protein [Flavobacteriales bacterium]|nr:patatin-like phospholipase family protein [Flavobacteriales bacterium]